SAGGPGDEPDRHLRPHFLGGTRSIPSGTPGVFDTRRSGDAPCMVHLALGVRVEREPSMTTGTPFTDQDFRDVLGSFPTGVVIVTSLDGSGAPVGMAVSAFNSVSLDPPLIAFFPKRNSETFPPLREYGSFCVNILSAEQQSICRVF